MKLRELLSRQPFLIACSIPTRDVDTAIEKAELAYELGADLVEFRIDYLNVINCEEYVNAVNTIVKNFPRPKIITLREVSEGGVREIDHKIKLKVLKELQNIEGTFVDIELEFYTKFEQYLRDLKYSGLIISKHYIYDRPSARELAYVYDRSRCVPNVDLIKVASVVAGKQDVLLLIDFLLTHQRDEPPYVTVLPMGNVAHIRLAMALLGSKLVFCSLQEATAPGQAPLDVCVKLKEILNRIL